MSNTLDSKQTAANWLWAKEISFVSSMETAHSLIDEIICKLGNSGWGTRDSFAANIALEEAFINAIQHGNHSDPGKQIHFICRLSSDVLYARIEDEGNGFDPKSIPNPADEDNLLLVSGRGILLIKKFTTRSNWNDKGNVLEFEIDRAG